MFHFVSFVFPVAQSIVFLFFYTHSLFNVKNPISLMFVKHYDKNDRQNG